MNNTLIELEPCSFTNSLTHSLMVKATSVANIVKRNVTKRFSNGRNGLQEALLFQQYN